MTRVTLDVNFQKFDYKKELDEQRVLFKECFQENHGTPAETNDHYLWKFQSFPDSPASYEYIAKLDGDIVGYYAALPFKYKYFGDDVTVGMVCDVMTGVKARGKGVFTKLGVYSTDELRSSGVAMTTGYPIRPEVIPGHLKAKWEIAFNLPLFILFLKSNSFLGSKKIGFISPFVNVFLSILHCLTGLMKRVPDGFSVDTYQSNEINNIIGFDGFLKKWVESKKIVLKKTTDFYNWRLGAPGRQYKVVCLKKQNEIVGVAIVRFIDKQGVPSMALLDYMVLDDTKLYSDILNNYLFSLAKKNNAEVILAMMSKHNFGKLYFLRKCYLKSPYKFTLIFKKFWDNISSEKVVDEKNWNLMWIDSDDL